MNLSINGRQLGRPADYTELLRLILRKNAIYFSLALIAATSWKSLASQADADALMKRLGDLHDSCIREGHVWTGSSVDDGLSMRCADFRGTQLRLLVQRQAKDPSAIELWFEELITFHLQSSPENYDSIIYSAELLCRDGTFYWADTGEWSPDSPTRDESTWIAANKLSWRDAREWMGPDLHYGSESRTEI